MSAQSNTGRVRQVHRKSRAGCHECKRRHVKCDEKHPTCTNCTVSQRPCSFLQLRPRGLPSLPLAQSSSPCESPSPSVSLSTVGTLGERPSDRPKERPEKTATSPGLPSPDAIASALPSQQFDMRHLVLLHHLENKVLRSAHPLYVADTQNAERFYDVVFQSAVSAPYLMDQLLALSALHLSIHQPETSSAEREQYVRLGTQLHIRALEIFNAQRPTVESSNCTAMLLFASILGQYALAEATMPEADQNMHMHHEVAGGDSFLDRIIRYLKLHHGIKAIVGQGGWDMLRQKSELDGVLSPIEAAGDQATTDSNLTLSINDTLQTLLSTFRGKLLSEPASQACEDAVDVLRWVFSMHGRLPKPYPTHIVMAWPVRISADFIELLELRQPVALVILAYWAMLLHEERDFWVVGNAGKRIIDHLASHLGSSWERWMEIPKYRVGVRDDEEMAASVV